MKFLKQSLITTILAALLISTSVSAAGFTRLTQVKKSSNIDTKANGIVQNILYYDTIAIPATAGTYADSVEATINLRGHKYWALSVDMNAVTGSDSIYGANDLDSISVRTFVTMDGTNWVDVRAKQAVYSQGGNTDPIVYIPVYEPGTAAPKATAIKLVFRYYNVYGYASGGAKTWGVTKAVKVFEWN